MMNTHNF